MFALLGLFCVFLFLCLVLLSVLLVLCVSLLLLFGVVVVVAEILLARGQRLESPSLCPFVEPCWPWAECDLPLVLFDCSPRRENFELTN